MRKNVISIIMCAMMLSGCSIGENQNISKVDNIDTTNNKNTSNIVENSNIMQEFPSVYQKEEGNVIFNCNVLVEGDLLNQKIYTATAQLRKIDVEMAFDKLYSDVMDYETYEYEEENEFGEIVKTATYVDKNETVFSYGPLSSRLSYSPKTKLPYLLSAFRLDETSDDYNADLYSTEQQLIFADREDIYDNLIQLFEDINAGTDYKYTAYALEHSVMESEEYHMDMDGNKDNASYKESWSEKDDCYYFAMRQIFEGIPVYHKYANRFIEEDDANTPVQVIVSAEGIEYLSIEKIFTFEHAEQVEKLVSFEEIAQVASDKFNMILGDGSYTFTSAELYYYVDLSEGNGTYSVYPCWILKGTQNANERTNNIQVIVDAQTGEEIIP